MNFLPLVIPEWGQLSQSSETSTYNKNLPPRHQADETSKSYNTENRRTAAPTTPSTSLERLVRIEAVEGVALQRCQLAFSLQFIPRFLGGRVGLRLHTLHVSVRPELEALPNVPAALQADAVIHVTTARTPTHMPLQTIATTQEVQVSVGAEA